MKTVPLRLHTRGRYRLCDFDGPRGTHRCAGAIVTDVPIEVAATLIATRMASLHIGAIPAGSESVNPASENSTYQRALRRRREEEALIRNYIASQPPQ
jgi:hypothetical protein